MIAPNTLYYFIALATYESMHRAAQHLNVTQPTLSTALKKLEKEIGTPLFTRNKKGITLTPAGVKFHSHAQDLLTRWQNLTNLTQTTHNLITGAYTIGLPTALIPIFAHPLSCLLAEHPNLSFSISETPTHTTVTHTLSGDLDLAITINPAPHPDLTIIKLYKSTFSLWQHPKLQTNKHTLIYTPNTPQAHTLIKNRTTLFGRYITTQSFEATAHLCTQQTGIAALPDYCIPHMAPTLIRCANAPEVTDEICLIFRTERLGIAALNTTITALKKVRKNTTAFL